MVPPSPKGGQEGFVLFGLIRRFRLSRVPCPCRGMKDRPENPISDKRGSILICIFCLNPWMIPDMNKQIRVVFPLRTVWSHRLAV